MSPGAQTGEPELLASKDTLALEERIGICPFLPFVSSRPPAEWMALAHIEDRIDLLHSVYWKHTHTHYSQCETWVSLSAEEAKGLSTY
jgi:hypothetical protein